MRKSKRPDADLKLKYRKVMEVSTISSLLIMLFVFHGLPDFDLGSAEIDAKQIEIEVADIPPTEQIKRAPPPPRPSVPIPTESEDVPEDMTIESTELDLTELPPPPEPPSDEGEYETYTFIPYDEPPTPIGGYGAILEHLKYPEMARKIGLEGKVVVGVLVDEKGNSVRTQILRDSGVNVGFEAAAEAAVMQVKWKPAKQRERPVKVWVSIPVRFSLADKA
ncbi:energy transducer TonB [candidate division KSB1 bacterium]|nr:energy transducer TonB [candidate division KSB1 bacterium]NIR70617.1 energy transducer TonB [candidate division KSB1 bacterium]NIS24562.1 energy transducer TonB [candidate division KSB1 bacterium]NIT71480.1 energy transducer TonB [candidate division KSB1 bacterium]NIU25171.1 energy transducer TonB [candidate division KSB1 bacterium]